MNDFSINNQKTFVVEFKQKYTQDKKINVILFRKKEQVAIFFYFIISDVF